MNQDFKEYNEDVSNALWQDSNASETEQLRKRVAELEAVLRECREALVPYMKYVDGTKVLNYPAQCVAKIDEVLPE